MSADLFNKLRSNLLSLDPVYFCENYLTLEGKPFRLTNNGYKPFADIYRYIAIKALERDSKPVVIIKGRQVGATTMCSALEMYFMGCGLFGNTDRPAMRIIHAFPQLDLAYAYSKTKLNPMISGALALEPAKKGQKSRSYMQALLDPTSPANDSLNFKQFVGGNHLWIESTGETADRLRGRSADVIFYDECLTYDTYIETVDGKIAIGKLVQDYEAGKYVPLIKTFNEQQENFEYKQVVNVWSRGDRDVLQIQCGKRKVKCTPNHPFLTNDGWKRADELSVGSLIKTSVGTDLHNRALNDDQYQVVLGSFLGDGNVSSYKDKRSRLRIIHGESQKEYCEWKASLFGRDCERLEENGFSKKPAYRFATKSFALPKSFPKSKTNCPQWVLDDLDARGIAVWFMDDGNVVKKWNSGVATRLSTCSFDLDTQERIVRKFATLGIDSHYAKYNGYTYIHFNKDGSNKLFDLISPYIHKSMTYKTTNSSCSYVWNTSFKQFGYEVVDSISSMSKPENVYDIEVIDNHNFIVTPGRKSKNVGGLITHNCQDIPKQAIGNASKILAKARYGRNGEGVQVFFGTPKQRGSEFFDMWQQSSQQYFNLHCEQCDKYYPLYTPGSDQWEETWVHTNIVRCPFCKHEQDKVHAAETGKWVATRDPDECPFIGFHMSQLFIPDFTKEKIISEKPENSLVNSERAYQNEVLGEFFSGETGIMNPEDVREKCGDIGRKFRAHIAPNQEHGVFIGVDIGQKSDLEQLVDSKKKKVQGQSYSCAVVLSLVGPNLLQIEFARKFKHNDFASKKAEVEHLMRMYSANVTVCDIGFSNDFCELMHNEHGEKFIASNAVARITDHIKYNKEVYPKTIYFERDYYIGELYDQMKKGQIRFPYGSYELMSWLVQHCTSMEIKPSISRTGEVTPHYAKGSQPNDGFMALLNAYIAYRWYQTNGFTIKNPLLFNNPFDKHRPKQRIPAILGVVGRMK